MSITTVGDVTIKRDGEDTVVEYFAPESHLSLVVIRMDRDQTLQHVARLMASQGISMLSIVDGNLVAYGKETNQ